MNALNKTGLIAVTVLTMFLGVSFKAAAAESDVIINGDHGRLAAILRTPDNRLSYPLVMLLHGFSSNKKTRLLTSLAAALEKEGIASIRFDFNGHGDSDGEFQDMTIVNEITDAEKVYEYTSRLPGVTSVSVVGHSQGGLVASMLAGYLGLDKIKSVVLMAPAAMLHDNAVAGMLFGVRFDALRLPEYVIVLGKYKIGRRYIETAQRLNVYATAAKYKGPVLIIHGTYDRVVPYMYGQRYKETYQNADLVLLNGFDHGFTQNIGKTAEIVADFLKKQLINQRK